MEEQIVQTGTPTGDLAYRVQWAFSRALLDESKIARGVLQLEGMSGRRYRHFANNLIRLLNDASYLEVGIWRGSTLCSEISGNSVCATAIDNWSQYGDVREHFYRNLTLFGSPSAVVDVIEEDFRLVDFSRLRCHRVFLFDGPHSYVDQYDGLTLGCQAITQQAVLIIDDWNWEEVRAGTWHAIGDLSLAVLHAIEIRTTFDNSHPDIYGAASNWHNGCFIAVVEKS